MANGHRHYAALAPGSRFHWYEVDSILGQGGFGITYAARDINLDQRVAIKEFLPAEFAVRTSDSSVQPLSEKHADTYGWGLSRFTSEAQTLARFHHPNIVQVHAVFEANNTAYMVMEYLEGESLENALKFGHISGEARLRDIFLQLLDGVERIHAAGFIHRDIKPENIHLRGDGTPVLIDFGSARQAVGTRTRTLTAIVSPGYAPYEQYGVSGSDDDKQGPWTDIYALGATLYRAVAGRGPVDSMERLKAFVDGKEILVPAAEIGAGHYAPQFLAAIDWALAFRPEERPRSARQWCERLLGSDPWDAAAAATVLAADDGHDTRMPPVSAPVTASPAGGVPGSEAETELTVPARRATGSRPTMLAGAALVLAALIGGVWIWMSVNPGETAVSAISSESPGQGNAAQLTRAQDESHNEAAQAAARLAALERENTQRQAREQAERERLQAEAAKREESARREADAQAQRRAEQAARQRRNAEEAARVAAAQREKVKEQAREEAARVAAAQREKAKEQAREEAARVAAAQREKAKEQALRQRQDRIRALLAGAADDLAALRLTSPPGHSALQKYREALDLDPGNEAAVAGLQHIVGKYLKLVDKAADRGAFEQAGKYLARAEQVLPGAENIAFAREALVTKQAQARRRAEQSRRVEAEREARDAEEKRLALEARQRAGQAPAVATLESKAAPSAQAKSSEPYHIAVLSLVTPYGCDNCGNVESDLANQILASLRGDERMLITHSFQPQPGEKPIPAQHDIWGGSVARQQPNLEVVLGIARKLGVDAVVMGSFKPRGDNPEWRAAMLDLYVVGVSRGAVYHSRGRARKLEQLTSKALGEFLAGVENGGG